jgi:ammonium transporter, Amt family
MEELRISIDTVWVVLCTSLIFFMNMGFAFLESGLCQSKNTISILTKNLVVFGISLISYWILGFGIQYGQGGDFLGSAGFFLLGADNSPSTGSNYQGVFPALATAGIPLAAKFLFQSAFASTCATIVSGAVAERIKLISFILFSLLYVPLGYSVVGHWVWGGGWLSKIGYFDFAGSSVVHACGGCAALIGAWLLGPRIDKWKKDLPAHNLSFATLGAAMLWFGWFGFNAGSTLTGNQAIAHIALTTNLAAAFGGITGLLYTWNKNGKPDLSSLINGSLGGLVAITASCPFVSPLSSVIIGIISGVAVIWSIDWIDQRLRIDDPVSAIGVHLVGGAVGILATGIFSEGSRFGVSPAPIGLIAGGGIKQIVIQCTGLISICLASSLISFVLWSILKSTLGLRVSKRAEEAGLDASQYNSSSNVINQPEEAGI